MGPTFREDAFFRMRERIQKFEIALLSHAEFVRAAANYYLGFANIEPKIEYFAIEHFEIYLAEHRETLPELAKQIDQDLRAYWRAALAETLSAHDELIAVYKKAFPVTAKKKLAPSGLGKVTLAHLEVVRKDLAHTLKKFPTYEFKDPEDVKHWSKIAKLSVRPLNNAHDARQSVIDLINAKAAASSKRIATAGGAIGSATKIAVDLGRVLLGTG